MRKFHMFLQQCVTFIHFYYIVYSTTIEILKMLFIYTRLCVCIYVYAYVFCYLHLCFGAHLGDIDPICRCSEQKFICLTANIYIHIQTEVHMYVKCMIHSHA